jgi:hypothetical protein
MPDQVTQVQPSGTPPAGGDGGGGGFGPGLIIGIVVVILLLIGAAMIWGIPGYNGGGAGGTQQEGADLEAPDAGLDVPSEVDVDVEGGQPVQ